MLIQSTNHKVGTFLSILYTKCMSQFVFIVKKQYISKNVLSISKEEYGGYQLYFV